MPTALALPSILDDIDPSAVTEHGRRWLSWTIPTAGEIHRNRYLFAWIEVGEREAWRGDALSLRATRRIDEGYARTSFTSQARDALHAEIVPVVARYGFDRTTAS